MEIQGIIEVIFEKQQITDSFSKREFVIQYAENPDYPEHIKMEFIQDKCDLLDGYDIGQEVVVQLNVKGRKWTDPQGVDKYFNTLQAWKISSVANSIPGVPQEQAAPQESDEPLVDDLPF
jgi:hypothetical protein